ncbi:hypothetical protein LQW54_013306 [Pestalotiopsis sp. IQ-011]
MAATTKSKRSRHSRPLSQKPAAVKLRELRKNRSAQERLVEKINSQRRGAVRRARATMEKTANPSDERFATPSRPIYAIPSDDAAAAAGNDSLCTAEEVDRSITEAFDQHSKLFVFGGEDEPLPFELFEARKHTLVD